MASEWSKKKQAESVAIRAALRGRWLVQSPTEPYINPRARKAPEGKRQRKKASRALRG